MPSLPSQYAQLSICIAADTKHNCVGGITQQAGRLHALPSEAPAPALHSSLTSPAVHDRAPLWEGRRHHRLGIQLGKLLVME